MSTTSKILTKKLILLSALAGIASGGALAAAKSGNPRVYVASGEVGPTQAVVWGRCNDERLAYFRVKLRAIRDAGAAGRIQLKKLGPLVALADARNDYTASVSFHGLAPDTQYRYQAHCTPVHGGGGPRVHGTFRTAPGVDRPAAVDFTWAADVAGQGWGRNDDLEVIHVDGQAIRGGYIGFETMHALHPDFVIHQGDNIYADNNIPPEKEIPAELGGGTWVNSPAKDFVAISLEEFRENWLYNLGDTKLRKLLADIPAYYQWDDHEVTNNWYPGEILTSEPYNGIEADVLADRAKQAFFEYTPVDGRRIFRTFQHGKNLQIFLLDERSFRGPNPENLNPDGNAMLGAEQLSWLKRALKNSTATWKVISTHDPLGIVVTDGEDFESFSNDTPEVLGREVELAKILKFIKDEDIRNVIFITSDVHFSAAIAYDPSRATFKEFTPFYEFVAGPLHAGAFGPGELDGSFGPEYEYVRAVGTEGLPANSPPPYLQSFGRIAIDQQARLTAQLIDIRGDVILEKRLSPK